MLLLTNDEVRRALPMSECLEALDEAFGELATHRAVNRPRSHTYVPLDEHRFYFLKSFDGAVHRDGIMALRLSSDNVEVHEVEGMWRRTKLPLAPGGRFVGFVMLFSIETSQLLALYPDGWVQSMRVGATNGLAAKYLARRDAVTVGLFGSGQQARSHAEAVSIVRPVRRMRIYSPTPANRERLARELASELGLQVEAVATPELAAEDAEILMCCTNSLVPVVRPEWLRPGLHIGSVQGAELDDGLFGRIDIICGNGGARPTNWYAGESSPDDLISDRGRVKRLFRGAVLDLGDVVAGRSGRGRDEEITLYGGMDGGGLGIQFSATGARILKNARAMGLGRELPDEWFTQEMHS